MRFLTPTLFLLAGVWVYWTNGSHTDRVVTLPLMDLFTADLKQQGQLSAYICFGIGAALYVSHTVAMFRRQPKDTESS
ncbi:MAG: hypothetical protein EXR69_13005 [Myxococcales bacterium]|nr:hypothetical protein [Myxococcales bacterium]